MNHKIKEPILNYWYMALSTPHGVELVTSDPEPARQRLYAVRREVKDTDLDRVAICISPFDPMKLWLVLKKKEPANEA